MAGNTDLVSGDTAERKSHVAFSDSITIPSVEIVLSQLNSMVCVLKESVSHFSQSLSLSLSQYNVCINTVEVRLALGNPDISSGSAEGEGREGEGETEVIVPSLRNRNITLLLRPHLLLPHTHYTASLSLDNQHSLSTSFCEWINNSQWVSSKQNTHSMLFLRLYI